MAHSRTKKKKWKESAASICVWKTTASQIEQIYSTGGTVTGAQDACTDRSWTFCQWFLSTCRGGWYRIAQNCLLFGWISVFWRKSKVFVRGEHSRGKLYKHSWPLPKESKHATQKVGKNCLKPVTQPKIQSKAVCLCFRLCAVSQSLSTRCWMETCRIMYRTYNEQKYRS